MRIEHQANDSHNLDKTQAPEEKREEHTEEESQNVVAEFERYIRSLPFRELFDSLLID